MRTVLKFLLRALALALAITLVIVIYPYARQWLSSILPQGKYEQVSKLLSHQMEKAGELTAIKHTDTGLMTSTTNAFLIGNVQTVKVPYAYEIGLGFKLSDVRLDSGESGITAYLPPITMLYDSFQVTGEPEVKDFWYKLSEKKYQQMLDEQAEKCRAEYIGNEKYLQEAWEAACEALEKLFLQWSGEKLSLTFEAL